MMTRLSDGTVLAPMTRWSSVIHYGKACLLDMDSEITLIRFENLHTEKDPAKLHATPLPKSEHGIRVPHPEKPELSVVQEPTIRELSDGRLICVMRALTGRVHFSLSTDKGQSWSEAQVLCYEPEGEEILNPITPCPMYQFNDGRFLLVFYNNDGSANGASSPADWRKNRYPVFMTVGHEIPGHPNQPIRFGKPKEFTTSDGVGVGFYGRTEVATYPSFLEENGSKIFFYPDRKRFLLGRKLTDEWLKDCEPST
jgi:hypothetical protein